MSEWVTMKIFKWSDLYEAEKFSEGLEVPTDLDNLISTDKLEEIIGYRLPSSEDREYWKSKTGNQLQIKKTSLGRGMGEKKLASQIDKNLSRISNLTKTSHSTEYGSDMYKFRDTNWLFYYTLSWGSSKYHMNFEFKIINISSDYAIENQLEEFIPQDVKDTFIF